MATGSEVMEMLRPNGGWIMVGNDYEGITFLDCKTVSKKEFEAGFTIYDNWKLTQENERLERKEILLKRLGITEDEAKLLLS